jgi:cellobiose-specific phosphotransferase system component IIA
MAETNHLHRYVLDLIQALRTDKDLDYDTVLQSLGQFRAVLEQMHSSHLQSCPEGMEGHQDLLLDAINCYYSSIDEIERFVEDPQDALLDSAEELAGEGHQLTADLLETVERSLDGFSTYS